MMMNDTLEPAIDTNEVDALRAGTWTLLGRLLIEPPSAEVRERLAAIESSGGAADALGTAWSQLKDVAREARDETLRREYQDVFVGVGGGEVTPYASWYLSGSLMDRPLVRLREDLESLGVTRNSNCSEPEDHAGAVCEIMAFAILDDDVDAEWQKDLFQRHAESWMGRLFEDIANAPSADFYRAVGALGKAFIELERRYYAMSV